MNYLAARNAFLASCGRLEGGGGPNGNPDGTDQDGPAGGGKGRK